MYISLGFIIVFIIIPIYILFNWKYFNEKKIVPWLYNKSNIEVKTEHFFKYQFISSIFVSLIIILLVSIFIYIKISGEYFPLLAVAFNMLLYIVKNIALYKGYIAKI